VAALGERGPEGRAGERRLHVAQQPADRFAVFGLVRWTSSKADGYDIVREDIRRLSPLAYEHITLTGRYHLIIPELIRRGECRPSKAPDTALAASA